jgi:hypothetical protein
MKKDMTLCATPLKGGICESCRRNPDVTEPNEYRQSWCNFKIIDNECNGYLEFK